MLARTAKVKSGFTLVELLVVIAIIGVLVALLLPAIQAAREAARRTQCKNNLKNIGLAVLNFESSLNQFPTGGTSPNVRIQDFLKDSGTANPRGPANGPQKQGLGWMFQILPYLEQAAVKNIVRQEDLAKNPIGLYNCPSRRSVTMYLNTDNNAEISLVDYAATTAGPTREEIGATFDTYLTDFRENPIDTSAANTVFWGCEFCDSTLPAPSIVSGQSSLGRPIQFRGIIQRTDWQAIPSGPQAPGRDLGFTTEMTIARITDGTSNTLLASEKWVHSSYAGGPRIGSPWKAGDDFGWADGWDYDGMRSCMFAPQPDSGGVEPPDGTSPVKENFQFGAAHSSGVNTLYADGSVDSVSFDVDIEVFNRMAHREDGISVTRE